mmetsp:Transcript_53187/g.64095  ORF Transcript_53187/g.64095 Transcript_53187/m.64095 type:complete len:154 (+) Transcript_53187:165-626(+)|eukprot:CAMPEP_0172497760 /NCGR_PEP_ID=MMETSP1066-20121228/104653_1 /TAXON_ID=671091 /ORGANISM="Coscinodiscus wailesii, Strain CCMP2513" /LENGTH=153 /DNA_ID=CAMNT_0013270707 /DNA_START=81 /DNA_END=542 /DNA_ORIENTATION=-
MTKRRNTLQLLYLLVLVTTFATTCQSFSHSAPFLSTTTVVKTQQSLPSSLSSSQQRRHALSNDILRVNARRKETERINKIDDVRRKQLGIADDEDEYDLDAALDANTDPLITKIIAGSAIVAIIALLVVGVIIPSTSDFGDGVCVPIQNGGRC